MRAYALHRRCKNSSVDLRNVKIDAIAIIFSFHLGVTFSRKSRPERMGENVRLRKTVTEVFPPFLMAGSGE